MCKRQKVYALDGTNQNDDSDWEYEQYSVESIENDLTQEKDWIIVEGLDGGVWYSLFIKKLAHYSSH